MPDEHASEFAETLAGLKSGDVESSDSEKPEFADIIDEEEIEQMKRDKFIEHFMIAGIILWFIIDTESFVGYFLFFL